MKFGHLLAGFGIAAGLFSLTLGSPRPARAAPDNKLGMALMSATVDANTQPNIVRGSGAVSVSRPGGTTGFADVFFDRDISNCTCTISVGENELGTAYGAGPGFVAIANCPYRADSARISTTINGSPTNVAFHLLVFCPK